ncbi:transcription elongation factor spt5, partial [Nowakowskiella sp. JEL0078]
MSDNEDTIFGNSEFVKDRKSSSLQNATSDAEEKESDSEVVDDHMDEDEDEDEEEEDEDEVDEQINKKEKNRKIRDLASLFIDGEAEDDDDDGEEEEEDDEEGGFLKHPEDGFVENGSPEPDGHHGMRIIPREEDVNLNEIADVMKARYKSYSTSRRPIMSTEIDSTPQQLLLPSAGIDSPKLWRVKCHKGHEKDVVLQVLLKFFRTDGSARQEPKIMSVFTRENGSSFVYIEALTLAHAKEAIADMNYISPLAKIMLVKVNEMVDTVTIRKTVQIVTPGSWVRVKRGRYVGDLAKVISTKGAGDDPEILLIPRIEVSTVAKIEPEGPEDINDRKRKKSVRIKAQRLTNEQRNVLLRRQDRTSDGLIIIPNSGKITQQGYLWKQIKSSALETKDVNPTMEEIAEFDEANIESSDLSNLAMVMSNSNDDYEIGDRVEVVRGELVGLIG